MDRIINACMRDIKTYKLFESVDEVESIDWNKPWKETWSIIKDILNRISQKIRGRNYENTHPSNDGLEWIDKKLCLRKDSWKKNVMCWVRSEEFYDEFIDFIVDMNDESNVEVELRNLSTGENKWSVRWKIPQKLTDKTNRVESHDVLGSMKLVNMLERAFRACNIKEKDIKWKITQNNTGKGYAEFLIYVEFKVEE